MVVVVVFFVLLLCDLHFLLSAAGVQDGNTAQNEDRHRRQLPPYPRPRPPDLERRQPPGGGGGYDRNTNPSEININFINKSGRRAKLFQSSVYGHEIYYQFMLRPNEPKTLSYPPDGTYWVAYDFVTNRLFLINGRPRLESTFIRPGINFNARIQSVGLKPEGISKKPHPPYFINTRVVLDDTMWKEYGENSIYHANVLLNIATRALRHRSLGVPLYLAVTEIIVMKERPSTYTLAVDRPDISVRSACQYAHAQRNKSKGINDTIDFSLIITRENIGPEGYASMYTMCTKRSCALMRDKGPDSGYVIAHELGHSLGIDHDENDECPRDNAVGGNLMVEKLYTTNSNYAWSRCSKKMIQQNIQYFQCLKDRPEVLPSFKEAMNHLPGELMSQNTQCQHYFGPNATACYLRVLTVCKYLWCRPKPRQRCEPILYHSPLEGTPCSKRNWCVRGLCIRKVKRTPVNGGWSEWSQFTPSCAKSRKTMKLWTIQKRNRTCSNPKPSGGGKRCVGNVIENRVIIPKGNKTCRPYKFQYFILHSGINLRAMHNTGCVQSNHKNKKWREYPYYEQQQQLSTLNLSCNFEEAGCGWKSSKRGAKQWNVGRGKTPSSKTGPTYDHTYKNKTGTYLFYEASWTEQTKRLKSGDRVILESPMIFASSVCLRFAYHLYGTGIESIEVNVRNDKHSRKMWSKSGDQGDKWLMAEIALAINIEYKISIEAIRGSTYFSDIAIDDLSVSYGLCETGKAPFHPCTTICRSLDGSSMFRTQLPNGMPCSSKKSANNVCFKSTCQTVMNHWRSLKH